MEIKEVIKSQLDKTQKFIFEIDDGLLTEFSYINKDDGKIIICASTQTGCNMGCTFCHLTGANLQKVRNLTAEEIYTAVVMIDDKLFFSDDKDTTGKTLLISYMGTGEPLENVEGVIAASKKIKSNYINGDLKLYKDVRFAVSTMAPKKRLHELFDLCREMKDLGLKIHYSFHGSRRIRSSIIPNGQSSQIVISALHYLKGLYKVDLEIHYTLIKGFNDHWFEIQQAASLGIPVKFLKLAPREGFENKTVDYDEYVKNIVPVFEKKGAVCEYYDPPGSDVGASCGQISLDSYKKD